MDLPISLDLRDRTLWFDGDSSISSDRMADLLLSGKSIENIYPLEIDKAVKSFNSISEGVKLELKTQLRELKTDYSIPREYLDIDLKAYLTSKLLDKLAEDNISDENDVRVRIARILKEIKLFQEYNIENLIRTTIYIVDTFKKNNIVWGTGRGSSCACYSLYVIGLHDVDSVQYSLDLNEFFR